MRYPVRLYQDLKTPHDGFLKRRVVVHMKDECGCFGSHNFNNLDVFVL